MTTENPSPHKPADPADSLQFEQAAFEQPAAARPSCGVCQQPIAEAYFSINDQLVCPACREGLLASLTGGSGFARFARALAFGLAAAVGAGLIWWGVRKATGYEIGLIAVVVGLMVGGAVRAGARGRGGIAYQLLAVALTYSCITSTYIPEVYTALKKQHEERSTTQPTTNPADDDQVKNMGLGTKAVVVVVFFLILFVIALLAPILAGFQNIIGLLIIAFALWEAWKINKKVVLNFAGPFSISAPPPPPAPPT